MLMLVKIWRITKEKDGKYDHEDIGGDGKSKIWITISEWTLIVACMVCIYDAEFLIDAICDVFSAFG